MIDEPDAASHVLASQVLRECANQARRFGTRARNPELVAAYEREALACEQVADWLMQRADRMNV